MYRHSNRLRAVVKQRISGSRAKACALLHGLDQIKMGGPASSLTGPGPCRNDLRIDGYLMKHGDQGDGGEFFEQVIGNLSGQALAGLGLQGLGKLGVLLLQKLALKEMRECTAGVGGTKHFFDGPQANDIGPDTAGRVLSPAPAREEDHVNVLYGGIDAHGLQIRRYRLRQWGDLRLGEL